MANRQTKNISREMSPFIFNFNFRITKKYIKNKNNLKKIFSKKKVHVVPAITDICTGGQQCKYQLLGSGVNISYYLHGGDFFCYCSTKNMKECKYQFKFFKYALFTELIQFYIPIY